MTTGLLGATASARGAAALAGEEAARGGGAPGLAQATSRMPTASSTRLHSAGGDIGSTLLSELRIRGVGPRPTPRIENSLYADTRRGCGISGGQVLIWIGSGGKPSTFKYRYS